MAKKKKKKKQKFPFGNLPTGVLNDGKKVETHEDVERRRLQVMEARASGLTIKETAKKFNISESLVKKDSHVMKKKYSDNMKNIDRDELAGELNSHFDIIIAKAFDVYYDPDTKPSVRRGILDTMLKTLNSKIKFVFDVGILNKIDKDALDSGKIGDIDLKKASYQSLKQLKEQKIKEIMERDPSLLKQIKSK